MHNLTLLKFLLFYDNLALHAEIWVHQIQIPVLIPTTKHSHADCAPGAATAIAINESLGKVLCLGRPGK